MVNLSILKTETTIVVLRSIEGRGGMVTVIIQILMGNTTGQDIQEFFGMTSEAFR